MSASLKKRNAKYHESNIEWNHGMKDAAKAIASRDHHGNGLDQMARGRSKKMNKTIWFLGCLMITVVAANFYLLYHQRLGNLDEIMTRQQDQKQKSKHGDLLLEKTRTKPDQSQLAKMLAEYLPSIGTNDTAQSSDGGVTANATKQALEKLPPPAYKFCPGCRWDLTTIGSCSDRLESFTSRRKPGEVPIVELKKKHPTCFIQDVHLEPAHVSKNVVHKDEKVKKEQVNLLRGIDGQWVQDWDYARRTAYVDHILFHTLGISQKNTKQYSLETALSREATSWKWLDANAPVTEINLDGFCKVCMELDITRILIIGDSLSRDFRRSLEALLGFNRLHGSGNNKFKDWKSLQFRMYSESVFEIPCTQSGNFSGVEIAAERNNWLGDTEKMTAGGTPDFVATNPNRTAIIFNTGAHMKFFEEYKQGFGMILSWIDSWDVDSSKLLTFYRDSTPGHPDCTPSKTSLEDGSNRVLADIYKSDPTKPYKNYMQYKTSNQERMEEQLQMDNATWKPYDFKHANGTIELYNAYARDVFENRPADKLKVHWLNVFNSTVLRQDGLAGFGGE